MSKVNYYVWFSHGMDVLQVHESYVYIGMCSGTLWRVDLFQHQQYFSLRFGDSGPYIILFYLP
jgi:hypothetical protein